MQRSILIKEHRELISLLQVAEFSDTFWEKMHLHFRGSLQYSGLYFSLNQMDSWLRSTRDGVVFNLWPEGDGVRSEVSKASVLSPDSLRLNFKQGRTQILKGLAEWPVLHELVGSLGCHFNAAVHVNAFVTPAGARTYPTYLSNDNIFVMQIEGEESWRLHEQSLLQLDLSQKYNFEFPENWGNRRNTPVLAEVHMKPGDLLYIPRGMPHFVESPKKNSLNLRIYITPFTWVDIFKIAAEYVALHSPEMRSSLPPGFVHGDETTDGGLQRTFEEVMETFKNVPFDRILAAARRNRVALQGFPPGCPFDRQAEAEGLTADSFVERIPDILCAVEEIEDAGHKRRSAIFFGSECVRGPRHLMRALKFIRDNAAFRVCELPGLDANGQLVLTRRLISTGLLRKRAEQAA